MMDSNLVEEFNIQINKELFSEYLYLAMKACFQEMNLQGFVNWFDVQVQEEHAHAMGMYDYLNERGGNIELLAIDKPEIKGSTPLEIFEQVLEHEEFVTSRINALMDVAEESDIVDNSLKKNAKAATDVALRIERMNKGIEDLADGFEDWESILRKSDKSSQEYSDAI